MKKPSQDLPVKSKKSILAAIGGFVVTALLSITAIAPAEEPRDIPPLRIVYFVPSDREPLPDRQERLGRVMKYVQDFYRREMERNGYGPLTFALEWDEPGKLKLYQVDGKMKTEQYGRNDAGVVRREVQEALKSQYGIEANQEVIVIFQLLLRWEGDKATEVGPYVGGGSHLSGTAWVYEDERLDCDLLASKEPGGYYHRPVSLGQFNTHYIGGLAHEMGHGFSLPHACELDEERTERGRALMGGGNHTFGRELRDEGKGAFLCASSALRLSAVRAFIGDRPGSRERAHWIVKELETKPGLQRESDGKRRSFVVSGRVEATPKLIGLIAYNDNRNIPSDYDAKTWTVPVDDEGRFRVEITELETVPYQLRLVGIHENGGSNRLSIDYDVTVKGIDLSPINSAIPLDNLRRLFQVGNTEEIAKIAALHSGNESISKRARHLVKLLGTNKTIDVASLPASEKRADLSWANFAEAKTGWGALRRAHVPEDVFLQIGGRFFDSGRYAHAPSHYVVDLDGRWDTFSVGYGLQDGHGGPVRFLLLGDDRELFRSDDVKDHEARKTKVSVKGVQRLKLVVESAASSGNNGAWGVWVNPILSR